MFATKQNEKPTIATVKLKNGSVEAKFVVVATMMSLDSLLQDNPGAFYELVTKCRDPKHKMFGNTKSICEHRALMNGDIVHGSIRNIVLSAVEGDGLDMGLTSPYADTNTVTFVRKSP